MWYEAYGWHVQHVENAPDLGAIAAAFQAGVNEPDRPSFIPAAQPHRLAGAPRPGHLQGAWGGLGRG